jgi:hypothetical protein
MRFHNFDYTLISYIISFITSFITSFIKYYYTIMERSEEKMPIFFPPELFISKYKSNSVIRQPVARPQVARPPVVRQPVIRQPVIRQPVARQPVARPPVAGPSNKNLRFMFNR